MLFRSRMAFPLAVARAVADTVAASGRQDFIVGYRFSPEEAPANGIKMADTLALIDELELRACTPCFVVKAKLLDGSRVAL